MIPILYVGPPGIGKTAIVEAQFDYVEKILLSTMTEEDMAGLPYREGSRELRTEPALFINLREADAQRKTTCLFLDELDKARREVADTLLTLVQSRKIGQWELPEKTQIIACANPPEWSGGDGISQAMQTRFSIVNSQVDIKKWCEWASQKFKDYTFAIDFIKSIQRGITPLLEHNGEGYDFRLTCPRTIDNALSYIVFQNKYTDEERAVVKGLLTANVASQLDMIAICHFHMTQKHQEILRKARTVSQNAWKPVRL